VSVNTFSKSSIDVPMETLINFDRWLLLAVNGSSSLYLDSVARTLTIAAVWIPLYLALFYTVVRNNNSVAKICTIVGCALLCYLFAGAVDDAIVKPLVARWRPTHDPVIGWQVDVVDGYRGGKYGFFSAHACNTFSLAVFFSLLMRSRLLAVTLVAWSLVNCWTRLYLGVHFPGDILVGLLWGTCVGVSVYLFFFRLQARYFDGQDFISSQYTVTGYQRTYIDAIVSVFLLTIVLSLITACLALR
jgi:undecaprenyl-diphosphatase